MDCDNSQEIFLDFSAQQSTENFTKMTYLFYFQRVCY